MSLILGILGCLVVFGLVWRGFTPRPVSRVTVDAEFIRRDEGRIHEEVRWADLERIVIVTTDEGPMCEDVFWIFVGLGGNGCAIPGSAVGDAVFDGLSRLPGVDYAAITAASGSAENASFDVWTRDSAATAA